MKVLPLRCNNIRRKVNIYGGEPMTKMNKMRIYEYARSQEMTSKEVIQILKRLNFDIRNHMSVMNEDMMAQVEQYMKDLKSGVDPQEKRQRKQVQSNDRAASQSKSAAKRQPKSRPKTKGNAKQDVHTKQVDQRKTNREQLKTEQKANKKQVQHHKPRPEQKKATKPKNKKGHKARNKKQSPVSETKKIEKITVSGPLTVGELAQNLAKEPSEIIKKLMLLGTMATINQELDMDVIRLLADEYGVEVEEKKVVDETQFELIKEEDDPEKLQERPPVVTVMGHVDHGKTTLLDALRHTNVTSEEAGGITQHIGAYQIEYSGKKITFLDTPGHEAFTTMRARGAEVTDVAIIVVAADDGVMPQTREAINHAKAAEVPIIVAVNKMDKEGANPDRIKQELTELDLVPEEWGGETIFVEVSALHKKGLDDLMEMVLLVAEVEELKANPDKLARGTVIEAKLDKGKGSVATVLVQSGTLRVGDPIVVGNTFGRVRAMSNDRGKRLKKAGPSTPVEITGLHDVPQAGDQFKVFVDEKKARAIGEARALRQKESEREATGGVNLDQLFEQIKQGEMKELNLILKADVHGSVEALKASLEKIEVDDVRVKIIHSGVGAITESDITLAAASQAIVIGFNVRPQPGVSQTAKREGVDIRLHRVIYDAIEEMERAMKGMLDPEYKEKVIGMAEVRQIFKVSKVGTIAGSYVQEGKITRDAKVRLIRDGVVIHEGQVNDLKRFKDDVREVQSGYECGITIENFNDIKEGDMIEAYIMEEIAR